MILRSEDYLKFRPRVRFARALHSLRMRTERVLPTLNITGLGFNNVYARSSALRHYERFSRFSHGNNVRPARAEARPAAKALVPWRNRTQARGRVMRLHLSGLQ